MERGRGCWDKLMLAVTRELLSHPTTGRVGRRLMETSGSSAPGGDTDSGGWGGGKGRGGESSPIPARHTYERDCSATATSLISTNNAKLNTRKALPASPVLSVVSPRSDLCAEIRRNV